MAVDNAGNATAAWIRFGDPSRVYARSRPVGGTWENDPQELDPGESVFSEDVLVAAAPGGEVVAVWVGTSSGAVRLRSASRRPGGNWTAAKDIVPALTPLRLVAGADGSFALLGYGSVGETSGLVTLIRKATGEWEKMPVLVPPPANTDPGWRTSRLKATARSSRPGAPARGPRW